MKHSILMVALLAACADPIEPSSDAALDEFESESTVQCQWVQRHSSYTELPCGTCIKLDTWRAGRAWVAYHENCFVCSERIPGTNTWREISASCQPRYPVATGCSVC